VTSGSTPISLTYDVNGNVTTDKNGNNYKWDASNRLVGIIYNSGANVGNHTEFAYDGLSRRTQIIERAGTTIGSGTILSTKNYLWIGSETAEERDASNSVTKRFFPLGEQQAGTAYYYTRDQLSSIRELCNSTGTIVARYAYDPYGRTTLVTGTDLSTFQFAGDYAHQPSGLNLTHYRVYDPNTARWLSRDPIKEKGGLNLYEYCNDDGINSIDPQGLASTTITITVPQDYPATNRRVHITAKSDCCQSVKFIQYVATERVWDMDYPQPKLDNIYSSDSFYANQKQTGPGEADMDDAPGPGAEGDHYIVNTLTRLSVFLTGGIVQEFVTCAICQDPGPNMNKILACIHWVAWNNGEREEVYAGPYKGN
jgi:RHS repeat-associated protein